MIRPPPRSPLLPYPTLFRSFISAAASTAALTGIGGLVTPSISRMPDRPIITHGIQSGDGSVDSGVVWARSDRAARMLVDVSTTDRMSTRLKSSHLVNSYAAY